MTDAKIFRRNDREVVVTETGKPERVFTRKPIYLPDQYERAVAEHLLGHDVIRIGMNGYSSLTPEQCRRWGVQPGAYEAACRALLFQIAEAMQARYRGIDIRFLHGASDMGVDASVIASARRLNRPQLGFSCPEFMFYVADDDVPVYVAATQEAYVDAFIRSLDVLIAANGRAHAFKHDIDAAFHHLKHVIPINVLKALSTTGGPPAVSEDGQIEDAVAAFEQHVHLVGQMFGQTQRDAWLGLMDHVEEVMGVICRRGLSPERAFGA